MCVHRLTEPSPGDNSLGYCDDLIDNCDYIDIAEKPIPTNKQLSILQLNIRGILGKQSLLTNFLKETNKHSKAQITLLQETWLKKGTEKRLKIPGYTFIGSQGMDHNLDLIKSDKHKPTKEFIEINLEHKLIPTITKPTRNSASLIDNIIIGRNHHSVYTSMILLTDLSDHCPTMLEMPNIDIYKTEPKKIYTRRLNPLNIKKINDKLQETDWETILDSLDTENSYSVYQETINNILNEISPVKEYTIDPNKVLKEQWMTPGLMKCTLKQRNLYKKTLRNSSNDIDHEK